MSETGVRAALDEWRQTLGPSFVLTDAATLEGAAAATFGTSSVVSAVLRPGDRSEVQRCVRIANLHATPLYPVSTGKNWGYGSSAPVRDAVLLDLSRLNRILDFNEELAYVTVEPGVTQRQLYGFLRQQRSRLWMDATGSSPDCSIIGNTLERGFGHTPMGDHCSAACGLEVVLANGDCIDTGFARFASSRSGALGRWGVGPSLDGLFSQSNLGIVTRMSVWLMPAPERFEAFVFQSEGTIGPLVEAIRPLRQDGTLRGVMHLGNDYKVISNGGRYPWLHTRGKTPLDRTSVDALRRGRGVARWSGSGAFYGTRGQVGEAKRLLRCALGRHVHRLTFFDDRKMAVLSRLAKPYRRLTRRRDLEQVLDVLGPLVDLLKGKPTDRFLKSAYWRKPAGPPLHGADPDRDRCGLLWCSPVAPSTGADLETVTRISEDIALAHGFEPIVSVSLVNERMTVSTIAITYDRAIAGEDQRAENCFRALADRLIASGYPPYRLNVSAMDYVDSGAAYGRVLRALKTALDPNGVLAPGRYETRIT